MEHFSKTRILTKDVFSDTFAGIKSMFGIRLKGFEKKAEEYIDEMMGEILLEGNVEWHRMTVNPFLDGIMINIYGEYKNGN